MSNANDDIDDFSSSTRRWDHEHHRLTTLVYLQQNEHTPMTTSTTFKAVHRHEGGTTSTTASLHAPLRSSIWLANPDQPVTPRHHPTNTRFGLFFGKGNAKASVFGAQSQRWSPLRRLQQRHSSAVCLRGDAVFAGTPALSAAGL